MQVCPVAMPLDFVDLALAVVLAVMGLVAGPRDPVERRATVRALALTAQRILAARQDAT
jgi:hypothetical protein